MAESGGVSGILGGDAETPGESAAPDTPISLDPTAAALAAEAARSDPELAHEASAYFRKQSHLVEVQTEHLHEQRAISLQLLKLKRFDERNVARLEQERRDKADPVAHFRHTLSVAGEQVEDVVGVGVVVVYEQRAHGAVLLDTPFAHSHVCRCVLMRRSPDRGRAPSGRAASARPARRARRGRAPGATARGA